jgi:hypothetical protein
MDVALAGDPVRNMAAETAKRTTEWRTEVRAFISL